MPKHTRIYTRTGDNGTTGLYSGARVRKNDARIEAYGTVDELSSAIGAAMAAHKVARIDSWLSWTQDVLFKLGAELATPSGSPRSAPAVREEDVTALEHAIDESEATLEPLDAFIHPGGSEAGAMLHVARTICRRAERRVLTLSERDADVDPVALRYLNRLSDALFVWARATNAALGEPERRWKKDASPPS
jgi:cob(I)alamin adenosyltransferase